MSALATDAIVLHAFNYLESSRIFKLVTRDGGVRSALARGARKSTRRFGTALDLFAQGSAELQTKPGRDLDTLTSFDVVRGRPQLAADLSRFAGANMIAELTLRFMRDAADPGAFEAVAAALDAIASSSAERTRDAALAGAWRILAELGVAPTIDACAECHASVAGDSAATFSHPAGGVLCVRCAHLARGSRRLPPEARDALRDWLDARAHALASPSDVRAHQRLLREFVREHLADDRALTAFDAWEHDALAGAPAAAAQSSAREDV